MNAEQQQIQSAVRQGDYAKAEGIIEKVLQQHPNSAKAHYIHAEILVHSQQLTQAQQEVAVAKKLDPRITFTAPEKFGQFEAYLDSAAHQKTHAGTQTHAVVSVPSSPAQNPVSGLLPMAGGILLFLVVVYAVFRLFTRSNNNVSGASYGASYGAGQSMGPNGGATIINNGAGQSSGAGAAVAAGLGGLAAGMLLERAMDGRNEAMRPGAEYEQPVGSSDASVPNYAEQQLDDQPFDMGNDSGGWGDSSGDSGGFDSGSGGW